MVSSLDQAQRRSIQQRKRRLVFRSPPKPPPLSSRPPRRRIRDSPCYALSALMLIFSLLALWSLATRRSQPSQPPYLRPHPSPKLTALPQFGDAHAERLLWGTYRPGLYFGLRPRAPKSLVVGLMWVDPTRQDALDNIRHQAQQRDGLAKYGWLAHDGTSFGRQGIWDEQYDITTSWVKNMDAGTGKGGDWGSRIAAAPRAAPTDQERGTALSLFLYVATEDGSPVSIQTSTASSDGVTFSGATAPFGPWELHMRPSGAESQQQPPVAVHTIRVRTPHLHNLTELVKDGLMASIWAQHRAGQQQLALVLPTDVDHRQWQDSKGNVAVAQITTGALPLMVDLAFVADSPSASEHSPRVDALMGQNLAARLEAAEAAFGARFEATFGGLKGEGLPAGTAHAARAALSNLLGGMGYWHGSSLVKHTAAAGAKKGGGGGGGAMAQEQKVPLFEAPLFSATPSRSFFPRGFLWDEGFHQLLVRRWSGAVSRDALAHWLDLMTADGWIPREQILGAEARARVPDEFIPQSPTAANPPTLFLPLKDMAQRAKHASPLNNNRNSADAIDAANDFEFLRAAYPRLRTWFSWYNTSQAGPLPGSYRWRGRDPATASELNPKTLTSGLDDYPRASHPSAEERHLDLRCWMALAARAMADISAAVGAPESEVAAFASTAARLEDFEELKALHWDAEAGAFADWGSHTESMALVQEIVPGGGGSETAYRRLLTDLQDPVRPQFVPHFGYVSLFPLITGLIPRDSPLLGQQVAAVRGEGAVWTRHGLRSLSARSSLYGRHNTQHDPPYWRGAVWINVNYLVLRALRRYAAGGGPHTAAAAKVAEELRGALLETLVGQYNDAGYLFEQYDDTTGRGKGSHPFTGWTALLALVAAE